MRTELIYWMISSPFAIILILLLLSEVLGVPDAVGEVVGLVLFAVYVLSLVLIVIALARRPARALDAFFVENGFTIERSRLFGRRYRGVWRDAPVEVRFLVGAGGIPSQLEARRPPQTAWFADALSPATPDGVPAWLDRMTATG